MTAFFAFRHWPAKTVQVELPFALRLVMIDGVNFLGVTSGTTCTSAGHNE